MKNIRTWPDKLNIIINIIKFINIIKIKVNIIATEKKYRFDFKGKINYYYLFSLLQINIFFLIHIKMFLYYFDVIILIILQKNIDVNIIVFISFLLLIFSRTVKKK